MSNINIDELNALLKKSSNNQEFLGSICDTLQNATGSKVVLFGDSGNVLSGANNLPKELKFQENGNWYADKQFYGNVKKYDTVESNLKDLSGFGKYSSVVPMHNGSMVLFKENEFSEDEMQDVKLCANNADIACQTQKASKREKIETAKHLLEKEILSFTELSVIEVVFERIKNNEGTVIASKIADELGLARSVTVNALSKLESANVVKTRSLGVKGTRIKVLNEEFLNVLKEFRNKEEK